MTISLNQLAQRCGIPVNVLRYRLNALIRAGVIDKYGRVIL